MVDLIFFYIVFLSHIVTTINIDNIVAQRVASTYMKRLSIVICRMEYECPWFQWKYKIGICKIDLYWLYLVQHNIWTITFGTHKSYRKFGETRTITLIYWYTFYVILGTSFLRRNSNDIWNNRNSVAVWNLIEIG